MIHRRNTILLYRRITVVLQDSISVNESGDSLDAQGDIVRVTLRFSSIRAISSVNSISKANRLLLAKA